MLGDGRERAPAGYRAAGEHLQEERAAWLLTAAQRTRFAMPFDSLRCVFLVHLSHAR